MTLEFALRASEVLLALALLQHGAEHIFGAGKDQLLFLPRAGLCLLLLLGVAPDWVLLGLTLHSILVLHRFAGPYNGGSDRMALLVLYCLCLARWLPDGIGQEAAIGYLGMQVVLSYFISGQVKIVNPEWRSGRALRDVFEFSAYPVSEALRGLVDRPRLLWGMSWLVMSFEVLFPLAMLNRGALMVVLGLAAVFHVANACVFGLNRFVWAWIAAYPSILWLQARLF
ncbi:MAG: HTTM domain-containing protein [Sulfitobacter sp.]